MSVWERFSTALFARVLHWSGAACSASDELSSAYFIYLLTLVLYEEPVTGTCMPVVRVIG